jgi:uncharacterized protein
VSARHAALASVAFYAAAASAVLFLVPAAPLARRLDVAAALLAGATAGAGAGLAVAARRALHRTPARGGARQRAGLLGAVVVVAACEEVVWRGGVLGGVGQLVGWPPAFAVSTVGFALRHAALRALRRLSLYAGLGTLFGAVYLATGRLVAAVAAHAAYNVAVAVRETRP